MRTLSVLLAILVAISGAILPAQTPNSVLAVVEGDIVNVSTGAPLSQARVKLWRTQEEDAIYGKVDKQGHFALRDLRPGFYQLLLEAPGFYPSQATVDTTTPWPADTRTIPREAAAANSASPIPTADVSKTTGDDGAIHALVTAPMLAYASIAGRITDPFGDPMPGAFVSIFKSRPAPGAGEPPPATGAQPLVTIQADSRGEYRAARLQPGTYWVLANKQSISHWTWQRTYRVTYYPAALDLASARPLKPEAGQEVRADIQVLRRSGVSVSGHLLGVPTEGSPWPPLTALRLDPVASDAVNPDTPFVQAKGEFEFKDVLPGKYTLYAQTSEPLSDPQNPYNQRPLFGLVKEVEIGTQDIAGFDLTLEPMKSLSGAVEIAGDCSPAPKFVQLVARHALGADPARAPLAADRTFQVPNVSTGRYDISVTSAEQPYNRIPLASAAKGARDVLKDGLESPWKDDGVLKITVSCASQAVRK